MIGFLVDPLHIAPPIHLASPCIELAWGVTERTGHIAHCRPRPVSDHIGHLGGVVSPITGKYVLDYLLATPALDIDINIGWAVTFGGQKTLK